MALTTSLDQIALFNCDLLLEGATTVRISAKSKITARRLALDGFLSARNFEGEPIDYVLLHTVAREVETRIYEVTISFGFDAADYVNIDECKYWFVGQAHTLQLV